MACEFFVESCRMEIFGVFEGCVRNCIPIFCKYIEDRLKKDPKHVENLAELSASLSYAGIKDFRIYV